MIDLSTEHYRRLQTVKAEFQIAVSQNNSETAQKKALEASSLCKRLADLRPAQRDKFLELADDWGVKSKMDFSKKHTQQPEVKESIDEYQSTIEGLITKSTVTWSDIGGMERVKQLLMETVVIAGLKKPDSIKPWKGILLFGPPGTGKTLLASAAAGSLDAAAFYDVKTSSVLSKYFGESSKLITALYNSARTHSPSIVFIDEFDSLSPSRDGEASEASRKVLSTLLTELDGLGDKNSNRLLLTLAATNTPWDLDTAVLSRFPRRIYVPLPDAESTKAIIKLHTKGLDISNVDLESISEKCVEDMFYSGRDLSNFSQQAVWNMVREANPDLYKLAEIPFEKLSQKSLKTRPLCDDDFIEGWKRIKSPLSRDQIERYEMWNQQYGES